MSQRSDNLANSTEEEARKTKSKPTSYLPQENVNDKEDHEEQEDVVERMPVNEDLTEHKFHDDQDPIPNTTPSQSHLADPSQFTTPQTNHEFNGNTTRESLRDDSITPPSESFLSSLPQKHLTSNSADPSLLSNSTASFQVDFESERNLWDCLHALHPTTKFKIRESEASRAARKKIFERITELCQMWIKVHCENERKTPEEIASAAVCIMKFGSFELDVHFECSDMDLLCIGPNYVEYRHFFRGLGEIFSNEPGVEDVMPITSAFVPVLKFTCLGINVDMVYVQTRHAVIDPANFNLFELNQTFNIESIKSLAGAQTTYLLRKLVPDFEVFQKALRVIKFWAAQRLLYSNVLGYLGGVSFGIMVAHVCQRHEGLNASGIVKRFFDIFHEWSFGGENPIQIKEVPENRGASRIGWDPEQNPKDVYSKCVILAPVDPPLNTSHNMFGETVGRLVEELERGYKILSSMSPISHRLWDDLLSPLNIFSHERSYLVIVASCYDPKSQHLWKSFVESKVRSAAFAVKNEFGINAIPYPPVDDTAHCEYDLFYIGLPPTANGEDIIFALSDTKDVWIRDAVEQYVARSGADLDVEMFVVSGRDMMRIRKSKHLGAHDYVAQFRSLFNGEMLGNVLPTHHDRRPLSDVRYDVPAAVELPQPAYFGEEDTKRTPPNGYMNRFAGAEYNGMLPRVDREAEAKQMEHNQAFIATARQHQHLMAQSLAMPVLIPPAYLQQRQDVSTQHYDDEHDRSDSDDSVRGYKNDRRPNFNRVPAAPPRQYPQPMAYVINGQVVFPLAAYIYCQQVAQLQAQRRQQAHLNNRNSPPTPRNHSAPPTMHAGSQPNQPFRLSQTPPIYHDEPYRSVSESDIRHHRQASRGRHMAEELEKMMQRRTVANMPYSLNPAFGPFVSHRDRRGNSAPVHRLVQEPPGGGRYGRTSSMPKHHYNSFSFNNFNGNSRFYPSQNDRSNRDNRMRQPYRVGRNSYHPNFGPERDLQNQMNEQELRRRHRQNHSPRSSDHSSESSPPFDSTNKVFWRPVVNGSKATKSRQNERYDADVKRDDEGTSSSPHDSQSCSPRPPRGGEPDLYRGYTPERTPPMDFTDDVSKTSSGSPPPPPATQYRRRSSSPLQLNHGQVGQQRNFGNGSTHDADAVPLNPAHKSQSDQARDERHFTGYDSKTEGRFPMPEIRGGQTTARVRQSRFPTPEEPRTRVDEPRNGRGFKKQRHNGYENFRDTNNNRHYQQKRHYQDTMESSVSESPEPWPRHKRNFQNGKSQGHDVDAPFVRGSNANAGNASNTENNRFKKRNKKKTRKVKKGRTK